MKTKESKYGRISYKESIFKSFSVGKPWILVQVSVEKINTNTTLFIEKIATTSIIMTNQSYIQMKTIDIVNWNSSYNNPEK